MIIANLPNAIRPWIVQYEGWLQVGALFREPRVGQGRHVLGGPPEYPHHLVVGGGHQNER